MSDERRHILSPEAEDDLVEISRYTSDHWGDAQRERYFDELEAFFDSVMDFPSRGQARSDLGEGIRQLLFKQTYWVYYRVMDDYAEIAHVLHTSRDEKQAFKRP